MEPFHYDFLGELEKFPKYRQEKFWVLFSYDRRDPLNHQAYVEYVYPEEEMQWRQNEQKKS